MGDSLNDIRKEYIAYSNKIGNRIDMYREVIKKYNIHSILYPGSHIDISPSFLVPSVIYVDSFIGTKRFFKSKDDIINFIEEKREYDKKVDLSFYGIDYNEHLDINKVDMIISQFAGFVGQVSKKYLKKNGILLCNDSHGDATLAYMDDDYEFIGVINHNNLIEFDNLSKYFKFKRERDIDLKKVKETMKGPKYIKRAKSYIFQLVR
jgi:hypothetical protein